jgi:hypothetical protein
MSIDTTKDFEVGQKVQVSLLYLSNIKKPFRQSHNSVPPRKFLHRVDITPKTDTELPDDNQIICTVGEKDATLVNNPALRTDVVSTTPNVFGGSSENGVLVGPSHQTTYVLDAPHSSYVVEIE